MADSCSREKCSQNRWHDTLCRVHWFEHARTQRNGGTKADLKHILMAEQGFRCANPGCRCQLTTWTEAHLDHDHACCPVGKVCAACARGVLCRSCNQMLGNARDDVARLTGASEYLESFRLHAKPMAIVERDRRGWPLHKPFGPMTPREREAIRDAARPQGTLSDGWKYRKPIGSRAIGPGASILAAAGCSND